MPAREADVPTPFGLEPPEKQSGYNDFARRVLIAASIVLALLLLLTLLFYTFRVVVLIFIGILIAVFLRGLSDWMGSWSRLPPALTLTVVIVSLASIAGFLGWLLTPHISEQLSRLGRDLPRATEQVVGFFHRHLGLGGPQEPGKLVGGFSGLFSKLGSFFSFTVEALADAIIVFFISLYMAFSGERYIKGIVKLVPVSRRQAALEVIHTLSHTLKWWLIGISAMMVVVGILSGIGLWLLGIPLALILGILAGLLTFIPYFGPILSAVPAILIALLVDFTHALYVLLLYLGIHLLEGYILSPLVQERTVYVPPILTLAALTAMGILLGVSGLIIATPFTAITLVLIKKIYIEGVLGDRPAAE